MKKLAFSLLFLCLSASLFSQMRMAILGGPLSASVKETNTLPGWETSIKPGYTSRSGLNLGVLLEIPIASRLYFQPGILYMAKGRKFFKYNDSTTSQLSDTLTLSSNLSVNYIEMPLNLTYKFPLSARACFFISGGPYIGFFYGGSQSVETRMYSTNAFAKDESKLESGKTEGKVSTVDIGLNGRVGFEVGSLILSGFMSHGLTNFYHAPYDGTFKHKVIGASIGFWLNKTTPAVKKKTVTIPVKPVPPAPKTDTKDSDGDGINDDADQCPDQPGTPEFNGCPIPDSDGDGLIDTDDKCPTEAGPMSNNGCPALKDSAIKEVEKKLNFVAKNIFFNAGSDQLTIASTAPLDEIVRTLRAYPAAHISIEGHTDASGNAGVNKTLSQKRAAAVKWYMVQNGIDESRLTAIGYGSERPLATDKTAAGRAENRRVEIKISR